jgi:hypothetical protein
MSSPRGGAKKGPPVHNLPPSFFRRGLQIWITNPYPPTEKDYYAHMRGRSGRPAFLPARVLDTNGKDELVVEWGDISKRMKIRDVYPMNDIGPEGCKSHERFFPLCLPSS